MWRVPYQQRATEAQAWAAEQRIVPAAEDATPNQALLDKLLSFDLLIVAGQAQSHCVAWTLNDLLSEIQSRDPKLAQKVYLLEDCTSPVVTPSGPDFTDQANAAFQRFADAGMHRVRSSDRIEEWLGVPV